MVGGVDGSGGTVSVSKPGRDVAVDSWSVAPG